MVKIRKCIFQLILTIDFMAFYFIKMHILLNVDKEASASVTPTRALTVDLAGGIASPKPHAMSPQPWRQIDAYACITPLMHT